MPHLFDLIYATANVHRDINVDLPPMYLQPASVDSARLLGNGASFTASVRSLPKGPDTISSTTDMGKYDIEAIEKPSPRPQFVVYKTARVAFDEQGEPCHGHASALKSVLTELHELTYPPLFRHPNIISYLGLAWGTNAYNHQHRLPALVVEYADQGTLADVLGSRMLTPQTKLALCCDVASGLEAIHNTGLIHGDVKAENVLICSGAERLIAKLADFGYSVVTEAESAEISIGGTWPWNAPETIRPIPVSDLKYTDAYSLGLLIWLVAVNGQSPFSLILECSNDTQTLMSDFASYVERLKQTNELIAASKVTTWYPAFMLRTLRQAPSTLKQLDETAMERLRKVFANSKVEPQHLKVLKSLCEQFVQTNPFLSKLDKILGHALDLNPRSRSVSDILAVLAKDAKSAPLHFSRLRRDRQTKHVVTNKSGETMHFKETTAWRGEANADSAPSEAPTSHIARSSAVGTENFQMKDEAEPPIPTNEGRSVDSAPSHNVVRDMNSPKELS